MAIRHLLEISQRLCSHKLPRQLCYLFRLVCYEVFSLSRTGIYIALCSVYHGIITILFCMKSLRNCNQPRLFI